MICLELLKVPTKREIETAIHQNEGLILSTTFGEFTLVPQKVSRKRTFIEGMLYPKDGPSKPGTLTIYGPETNRPSARLEFD